MIAQKLQILVELLKQGDGAQRAAGDLKTLEGQSERTTKSLDGVGSTLKRLAAGVGLSLVIREIIQTSIQAESLRTVLTNVTGSTQKADAEFRFLKEESNKLGAEFQRLAPAYAGITAAARGTALEGENTRQIFLGVAAAATANQRSSAEMEGALLAIQQMMSKGVVSAEELRGQLGERIPGAFELAAKAMGMTTQEFNKALEAGQVFSNDFLPRFADVLIQTFGEAARKGPQTLNGQLNILKNNLFDLRLFAAEQGIGGAFKSMVVGANATLGALNNSREALTAVSTAATLAALAIGGFIVQGAATRLMASSFVTSAGSMTAALGTLRTASVSTGVALNAAFVGVASAIWVIVEALRALNAENERISSEKNLLWFNEKSRARLEEEIDAREAKGTLDRKAADSMRAELQAGFMAREKTISVPGTAMDTGGSITVPEHDPKAQFEALKTVRQALYPGMVPGTADQAQQQQAASEEQKKAAEELASLRRKMEVEAVSGLERERLQAQQNYQERLVEIDGLAKKSTASSDEITALKAQNEGILSNQLERIEQKRISQQQRQADQVRQFREDQTLATLTGYEREMKAAEINFQRRREQILELVREGMSATEEAALHELNLAVRVSDEKAAARQLEQENYRQATEQLQALEARLAAEAQMSSMNRVELARISAANLFLPTAFRYGFID